MPQELGFVGGDVLDPGAGLITANIDDPVDEQEWIAMRQRLQYRGDIHGFERRAALGFWDVQSRVWSWDRPLAPLVPAWGLLLSCLDWCRLVQIVNAISQTLSNLGI